ncbi:helix-turn-helix transcriptional regulator [Bacillus sp. Hm123]|uniref:helix-turn-helix transcriptional regulator n=1 Tax=Bacillus sp. Hm123 TaxID=3450745 RepID=UPI003F438768
MNKELIAKKLVSLRGNKTRSEVSTEIDVSESALAMYETGKRVPRDDIKVRIAKYYKKTVQEIFFEDKLHEVCCGKSRKLKSDSKQAI